MKKNRRLVERLVILIDVELQQYLRQRSHATGAPIGELVRRAIQLTRYAESVPEKALTSR